MGNCDIDAPEVIVTVADWLVYSRVRRFGHQTNHHQCGFTQIYCSSILVGGSRSDQELPEMVVLVLQQHQRRRSG